jgi:hypothetical protein
VNAIIKSYSEKQMSLKLQLSNSGFVFQRFEPLAHMRSYILELDKPTEELETYIKTIFDSLQIPYQDFDTSFEDTHLHTGLNLHTHLIPASFQVLMWVPESSDYLGRGFIYGSQEKTATFYPQFGDLCLMKTNDLNFFHGVEPLKSNIKFRTIIISVDNHGKLGQQLTVAKSSLDPI